MKKKFVFAMALAMIAVLLFSGLALAGGNKTEICHLNKSNDVVYGFWGVVDLHFGKVIKVSDSAVGAHEAHGDSSTFFGGEVAAGPIAQFKAAGVNLPAANCYISVPMQ